MAEYDKKTIKMLNELIGKINDEENECPLNDWEKGFINDMADRVEQGWALTQGRRVKIEDIYEERVLGKGKEKGSNKVEAIDLGRVMVPKPDFGEPWYVFIDGTQMGPSLSYKEAKLVAKWLAKAIEVLCPDNPVKSADPENAPF
jgi:hypothetical protein